MRGFLRAFGAFFACSVFGFATLWGATVSAPSVSSAQSVPNMPAHPLPSVNGIQLGDDIKDIRGIFDLGWEWMWAVWVLVAILVLGLIGLSVFLWKRRKRCAIAILSPFDEAMQALGAAHALIEKHSSKELASTLSDAIRRYIERTFNIPVSERTTEEFLAERNPLQDLPKNAVVTLKEFLETCDLAKFAKATFIRSEAERLYERAKGFVELTDREQRQKALENLEQKGSKDVMSKDMESAVKEGANGRL